MHVITDAERREWESEVRRDPSRYDDAVMDDRREMGRGLARALGFVTLVAVFVVACWLGSVALWALAGG